VIVRPILPPRPVAFRRENFVGATGVGENGLSLDVHGVTAAAEKSGASRFSIYQWQRKVKRAAKGEGPSPTSGPSTSEIEAKRDAEILDEYKTHAGLGPSQIRNQLARKNVRVSVHTVRRVMEGAGYRPPKVERKKHDRRYNAVRPNHMWHLDFVQRYIGKASTFTLILIDDCSRFVVGHGVDDAERADMVIETFEQAVARHGRPERVTRRRRLPDQRAQFQDVLGTAW